MTKQEIQAVLEAHGKWLRIQEGGVRANLADADLRGAYLAGADLADADLGGANLADAYLDGANLSGANLDGTNLSDANLSDANLCGANLSGANLSGANLSGVKLRGAKGLPAAPVVPDLHRRIADAVGDGEALYMDEWHADCGTRHCRAGWSIVLAGEEGEALEKQYGPALAGALIYHASTGMIPDLYASNKDALADIRRCAGLEGGADMKTPFRVLLVGSIDPSQRREYDHGTACFSFCVTSRDASSFLVHAQGELAEKCRALLPEDGSVFVEGTSTDNRNIEATTIHVIEKSL